MIFAMLVTNLNFGCLIYAEVKRVDIDALYDAHAVDVYHFALSLCGNKHMAEDITGETFVSAIKGIDRFLNP